MKNVVVTLEPFCWTKGGIFSFLGPTFTIVSMVPYALPFVNCLIVGHNPTFYTIYLMIYVKLVTVLAHIMQGIIQWERPYPECTPSILTRNGFPDPGLVYLWSSALTGLFLFYRNKSSAATNSWSRGVYEELIESKIVKTLRKMKLMMLSWEVAGIIKIFKEIKTPMIFGIQIIGYLAIYKMAFLASTLQIILSALFSTIMMGVIFVFITI